MNNEEPYKIISYDPSEKKFLFNLDAYSCYKERTGVCSLEQDSIEKVLDAGGAKSTINYCRDLYKSFIKDGIGSPVFVDEYGCGHVGVTDGQHRICIAKRKDLIVPAYVRDAEDYECSYCFYTQRSIMYKIKSLIGRKPLRFEKYFIETINTRKAP